MESITRNLLSSLSVIPQIIVLIAVLMYVTKRSTPQGILMLIGAVVALLLSLVYTIGFQILADRYNFEMAEYREFYTIAGWVGALGHLCFAVGLLLLISDGLKRKAKV